MDSIIHYNKIDSTVDIRNYLRFFENNCPITRPPMANTKSDKITSTIAGINFSRFSCF